MIFGGQARPAQQQSEPQLAGPTEGEIKSRRELCRQELLEGKLEDLTIDIMVDDNDSVPSA